MKKKKQLVVRGAVFLIATAVQNVGISMTVQADFGVSAAVSLPYSIAKGFDLTLSHVVFAVYCLELALQFLIRGRYRRWRDLLQIPVALFASSVLDVFQSLGLFRFELLWQRIIVMAVGLLFIGAGTAAVVDMRVVPGPPAGLTEAISWRTGLELGLAKNLQDAAFVLTALIIDLAVSGKIVSLGAGTVAAVLAVGRVVALFNRLFLKKLLAATGLPDIQKK